MPQATHIHGLVRRGLTAICLIGLTAGPAAAQTPPTQMPPATPQTPDSAKQNGLTQLPAPPVAPPQKPGAAAMAQDSHAGHGHGGGGRQRVPTLGDAVEFSAAGILVDTPVYNFGKAMSGVDIIHDFWITNPGKELLKIESVKPSCGCTTAAAWDREIPPGESGRIPIKLSTKNAGGRIAKTISVTTNCKEYPAVVLQVEGEVWRPVQLTPANVSFGTFTGTALQEKHTQEVTIVNNLSTPLEITEVICQSPVFRAEVKPVEAGKSYKLTVTANPPFPAGSVSTPIMLKTNMPDAPEIQTIASAYVPAPVQIFPGRLVLPPQAMDEYERQVQIRNNTGRDIKVSNLISTDPNLKVSLTGPDEAKNFQVVVKVPTNYAVPTSGASISMDTDEEAAKKLVIYVTQAAARPVASLKPAAAAPGSAGPK